MQIVLSLPGVGRATAVEGQYLVARIAPLTTTRAELAMTFSSTAPASSQPKWLFIVRSVDLLHEYKARVRVAPNGAVIVGMYKVVGNTFPQIGAEVTLPGITWSPGTKLRIRADASASSTCRSKATFRPGISAFWKPAERNQAATWC